MKLRKVEGSLAAPNFFLDHDSGIYYVKRMLKGEVKWKSTRQTNPAKAARRYREIMGAMDEAKGGWEETDVPTLAEWWTTYRQSKTKSDKTWAVQAQIMEAHVLPQLGRKSLDELTPSILERHFNWRQRKAAASTVSHEMRVLRAVLNAAVDDDLLVRSPMRKMKPARYQGRTRVVSPEEEQLLLNVLKPANREWFTVVLGTGIRLGGLRSLTPERVNLAQREITVTSKGKTVVVPILEDVVLGILEKRLNVVSKGPLWKGSNHRFQHQLLRAAERAGIDPVSPHILRHTFATRYLQGGGDIYVLSTILGHASVRVTEEIYAHLRTKDKAKLSAGVDLKLRYAG